MALQEAVRPKVNPHVTERARHLVICGGGASAVMLVQALRQSAVQPLDVTIVEERTPVGSGLAYSTLSPHHLLNVPAGRMSADAQDPASFVNWLNAQDGDVTRYDAKSFVPRSLYGAYLKDLLALALADLHSPVQVRVRHASVTGVVRTNGHWTVTTSDGRRNDADAVVIATGNERPRPFTAITGDVEPAHVIQDPWERSAKDAIAPNANVALIGSGLTAVDVAVELLERGHRGQIKMISRHGLLPRKHAPALVAASWLFPPYPRSIADLVRKTRDEAHRTPGDDAWRTTIDALRPNLPAIWAALDDGDKVRFLRHVRPFWEVHRHRMAPQIAQRLEAAIADKRLVILRGRIARIERAQESVLNIRLRPHGRRALSLGADLVINCTGPDYNPRASQNPLINSLLAQDLARPDPLHLGLDTDDDDCVLGSDGTPQPNLYAIGPVARGRLWEVTAVPEIRQQAALLSRRITLPEVGHEVAYTI